MVLVRRRASGDSQYEVDVGRRHAPQPFVPPRRLPRVEEVAVERLHVRARDVDHGVHVHDRGVIRL